MWVFTARPLMISASDRLFECLGEEFALVWMPHPDLAVAVDSFFLIGGFTPHSACGDNASETAEAGHGREGER